MQLEDACGTDCSGHMQHQAGGLVTRLVVRAEKGRRQTEPESWNMALSLVGRQTFACCHRVGDPARALVVLFHGPGRHQTVLGLGFSLGCNGTSQGQEEGTLAKPSRGPGSMTTAGRGVLHSVLS